MASREKIIFRGQHRYDQIAYWMREDSPDIINNVETVLQVDTIEKAFEVFVSRVPNGLRDDTLQYLIRENMTEFGNLRLLGRLFKTLFGSRVTKGDRIKAKRISKEIEEREEEKIEEYKKTVVRHRQKITISYVRIGEKYQKRARDEKGHFVKIPKED